MAELYEAEEHASSVTLRVKALKPLYKRVRYPASQLLTLIR